MSNIRRRYVSGQSGRWTISDNKILHVRLLIRVIRKLENHPTPALYCICVFPHTPRVFYKIHVCSCCTFTYFRLCFKAMLMFMWFSLWWQLYLLYFWWGCQKQIPLLLVQAFLQTRIQWLNAHSRPCVGSFKI